MLGRFGIVSRKMYVRVTVNYHNRTPSAGIVFLAGPIRAL
jgi:hypothetical protein